MSPQSPGNAPVRRSVLYCNGLRAQSRTEIRVQSVLDGSLGSCVLRDYWQRATMTDPPSQTAHEMAL